MAFSDVFAASIAIGDMRVKRLGVGCELDARGWASFARRANDLYETCEKALSRLSRIEPQIYKMDARSMVMLIELEEVLPRTRIVASAVVEHAEQTHVRMYGGPIPPDLEKRLGRAEGELTAIHNEFGPV